MKIFPTDREKIYTYVIFAFFIGFALAFIIIEKDTKLSTYIGSISTLLGAYLGANFAFKMNENREKRNEHNKSRNALNFALFTLARQLNAMVVAKRGLTNFNTDFQLAFNMPAYKAPEYQDLKHNFNNLSFLLDTDTPHMLMELTIEQERFEQAMEAIKIRNEFYVEEFQPLVEKHKLDKTAISAEKAEELLGPRVFYACIQGATEMRDHINRFNESAPLLHQRLHNLAKSIYPGKKFVIWKFDA